MRGFTAQLLGVVLLLTPFMASAQRSKAFDTAREALHAWDVVGAGHAVRRLQTTQPDSPDTLFAAGYLDFLQGRYGQAAKRLERTLKLQDTPYIRHLRDIVVATANELKQYDTYRTKKGHFEIRYRRGLDEVLLPYAERALERAYGVLVPLFGHTPRGTIRVEIYPRVDVLAAVSPLTEREIKTSGTIALCKYNRLMIVSPRELVYGYAWADTLAHELIHLLVTQKSRNRVPIWLHEGLARYFQEHWKGTTKPKLPRASSSLLAQAIASDSLISFEAMSPSMAKLPSQEASTIAFAEVFTVIAYLVQKHGDSVASRLPALLGKGLTDKAAVAQLAGVAWPKFTPAWKSFLKKQGYKVPKGTHRQRLFFKGEHNESKELGMLAEEAKRYAWLGDQLRLKGRMRAAEKEYRKAAKRAGDDSPIIDAKLAFVLLQRGEAKEVIRLLKNAVVTHPGYVLLSLYMGQAYARLKSWDKARTYLEQVLMLNPFDTSVHVELAKVYRALGEAAFANREDRMQRIIERGHGGR